MMSLSRVRLATVGGLLLAGTIAYANGTRFSDFFPLAASAGPTANEAFPLTLSNPAFKQWSIADRSAQLAKGAPNSGDWDMNTVNETGPHKGRYLFTVFETGSSGIQRHDLLTHQTDTIWHVQPGDAAARFDPATSSTRAATTTGRSRTRSSSRTVMQSRHLRVARAGLSRSLAGLERRSRRGV